MDTNHQQHHNERRRYFLPVSVRRPRCPKEDPSQLLLAFFFFLLFFVLLIGHVASVHYFYCFYHYDYNLQIFLRHRPKMTFLGVTPFVTNDTFIAPSASVIGEVTNWDQSSVWYGAVVRADSSHPITIGFNSSVGEGSVVSTLGKNGTLKTGFPPACNIGHYVTIGAGSVLKSCRVDDLVVIGEKCTILEGALVEANVVLEPGTVVPAYARIPSGQKWGGNPAKFISNLDADELADIKQKSLDINQQANEHALEFLPVGNTYVHLEELERQHAGAKQG